MMLLLVAGCKPAQKTEAETPAKSMELVPVDERSKHFAAVSRHLELGGTLFGYADVDGDVLKFVPALNTMAGTIAKESPMAAPFLKQDFTQIFKDLGFNDVRAIGVSSVPEAGGGFRNRVFFYMPEGRHGLLSCMGGAPAPFGNARLAPVDADLYAEMDMDIPAVYAVLKKLVAQVAGTPLSEMVETQLKADQSGMGVTPLAVIQSLKGRATIVLRTDPERTITVPGETTFKIPATQLFIRVDGLGAATGDVFSKLPMFKASVEGAVKFYTLSASMPLEGLQPVIAVEGSAIYIASNGDFLRGALAQKTGLDQAPAFKQALAALGDKGNGITYVSPRLFAQIRRIKELNPQLPAEGLKVLDMVLDNMPSPSAALVSVRTNLPDGILYRSHWNASLKKDVAMVAVYNPVVIGLMAAMAIPAFQKVRAASQEKAIINNLRQLSAAADQHMLENGTALASYSQLVGPNKYIRSLKPVAGEDYTGVVIHSDDASVSVTTSAGKVVTLAR